MNLAKIFIAFTFLLAFAVCVSAQDKKSKIVWKNLQEKYEGFEDVKPIILNEGRSPIYFIEPVYERVQLLRFDEKTQTWIKNYKFVCFVGTKIRHTKFKPNEQIFLENIIDWITLLKGDGVFDAFPARLISDRNARYKLQVSYLDETKRNGFEIISPEFSVNESIENQN